MKFKWDDERIDHLKRLIAERKSSGEAADVFICTYDADLSRSALIGKAHRLGLHFHSPWRNAAGDGNRAAQVRTRLARGRAAKQAARVAAAECVAAPAPVPTPANDEKIPPSQRKGIFDLKNHHCRWPVGDPGTAEFFFCGSPTADLLSGHPYCAAHAVAARGRANVVSDADRLRRAAHTRRMNSDTRTALLLIDKVDPRELRDSA